MPFVVDPHLVSAHRRWLSAFDARHRLNWERMLADAPESAMCEAAFRRLFDHCVIEVVPNEDLAGERKTPDFRCEKNGQRFYAEVTCLTIQRVVRAVELPDGPFEGRFTPTPVGVAGRDAIDQAAPGILLPSIMGLVRSECADKVPQCAGLDAPAVVCVGTFHPTASWGCIDREFMEELLCGSVHYVVRYNKLTGQIVDSVAKPSFDHSVPFRQQGRLAASVRQPISAVLVAGFGDGTIRETVMGVLHHDACRPFDPTLLPRIPFCRLAWTDSGRQARAEWGNREEGVLD